MSDERKPCDLNDDDFIERLYAALGPPDRVTIMPGQGTTPQQFFDFVYGPRVKSAHERGKEEDLS